MAQLYLSPIGATLQYLNNLGVPLAGGLVNIYVGGSVNTPQNTFTDSTGTTLNAQPIVLNSAGRLASGAAPVEIWVPANTPHKLVVTDSVGNVLVSGAAFDFFYGINDPTATQNLLLPATVIAGTGADLVANAVKSYSTFAALRAFGQPATAVPGQTQIAYMEGGSAVGDGNGGAFYWSSTSSAADDGISVIRPTGVLGAGRWLRIVPGLTEQIIDSGTFNGTLTGFTAPPVTCICTYKLTSALFNGVTTKWATLAVDTNNSGVSGTSSATTMTMTGIPSEIVTNGYAAQVMIVTDNSGPPQAGWAFWAAGVLTFGKVPGVTGGFTASGTKGIQPFQMTYPIQ